VIGEPLAAGGQEGGVELRVVSGDEALGATVDVRELYERYADDVFRYLARRLGDGLAHDLTADTFRIAIQRASSFDPAVGHPRAWLYGIASNLVRGHWRTEQRRLRATCGALVGDEIGTADERRRARRGSAERHIRPSLRARSHRRSGSGRRAR
jgi:DNA-directed RNA polymerase specialized sigma24 family protein